MKPFVVASTIGLILASAPLPAGADENLLIFVHPEAPRQGDIVRFTMRLPTGATGGVATFDGVTLPGFVTGGLLNVYFGIDMDTEPGTYDIEFAAGTRRGTWPLVISERTFKSESLTVASKYTDLDEDTIARVTREKATLDEIWKTVTHERLWAKSFVKPANGPNGSPFGLRRYFNEKPRSPHSGLDIKAPVDSGIYASNAGRVVLAEDLFFTGNTVIIDHGLGLYTIYAHMSRMDVEKGALVERSQQLGLVGATGRVTGPHLHWGVKLGGARVDPATLPGVVL